MSENPASSEDRVRVEAVDAAEFAPWVASAATVYGEAMGRSPEVVVQRRELIGTHLRNAGLVATVAVDGEELVGFGYGYRGRTGQWWYDAVSRELGRAGTRRWLQDSFELAELHVLPTLHGRGIGTRLLRDVLERAATDRVVLSTGDRESPARRLYRRHGFTDLLTGFYFPGSSEPYAVMGRDASMPD
jgi:ribosomal protein S18 acetylase RimI-like enzyme